MQKRTTKTAADCLAAEHCPISDTIEVIGGRWKPLILYHLRGGSKRFSELRRLMPSVTQRMLTQHLRELESDGVIIRTVREKVPPHVDYEFSARGRTLLPILDAMAAWPALNKATAGPDQSDIHPTLTGLNPLSGEKASR